MLSKEGADFTKVLKRYDIDMQVTLTPEEMAEKMLPTDPVFRKVADQVLHMQKEKQIQRGHLKLSVLVKIFKLSLKIIQ